MNVFVAVGTACSPGASFASGEEFRGGRRTVVVPFPRLAGSLLLSRGFLLWFLWLFKENRKAPLSWFPFLFFLETHDYLLMDWHFVKFPFEKPPEL